MVKCIELVFEQMDECDAPAGRVHARLSLWQVVFRMLILVPVGQPSIRRPCQRTLDIEQPCKIHVSVPGRPCSAPSAFTMSSLVTSTPPIVAT